MVVTLPSPIVVVAGKNLDVAFQTVLTNGGPRQPLEDWPQWEIRIGPKGADTIIWSTDNGALSVDDDFVILHVAGDDTDAMKAAVPTPWDFLLSYGADEPETPLLWGQLLVRAEP